MNDMFYQMIFKRKSFHLFRERNNISISLEEIEKIKEFFKNCKPLIEDIKVDIKIKKADETTCKRNEEYCICLYSENKDNYLANIGYIGEQMDLYLASLNIGALWFGIGKVINDDNKLEFVIMIAIAHVNEEKFRSDMYKSKRKPLEEIWIGEEYKEIGNIVRFTPSACNTQPWKVYVNNNKLEVYRYKKPGKRGIMPVDKVIRYNRIDMGIFLFMLELCLEKYNIKYNKELFNDNSSDDVLETKIASYNIIK